MIAFTQVKLPCLLLLLITTLCFFNIVVRAEEEFLPESGQNIQFDGDFSERDYSPNNSENSETESQDGVRNKTTTWKNPIFISDSAFANTGGVTLKGLVVRTSLIVLFLLVVLLLVKLFLNRNNFEKPGSILDNFAAKLSGVFSNTLGMRLEQTLILTPGQNLYVVNIDGKRLLLGGTHQGGVQFLADLTEERNISLVEPIKHFAPLELSDAMTTKKSSTEQIKEVSFTSKVSETPFLVVDQNLQADGVQATSSSQAKFPFKRRTSFRQTLLSNVK